MKKFIIFLFLINSITIFAQNKNELFYFTKNKDGESYIGVKDASGKVIIPAQMKNITGAKNGELVKDLLLSFYGCPDNIQKEKNAWGCVFDRNGDYLYQSFAFDNGPDYYIEGYQRIIKNGKIGFANRKGLIIIQAQFDYVTSFNYGYAKFCSGFHWDKADKEHPSIVGGKWGVINVKGEIVLPHIHKQNETDILIDGKYYPYPFKYNKKEQKILSFFNDKNKLLANIAYVNLYNKLNENQKVLYFEIIERPCQYFPYYEIYSYDYERLQGGLLGTFLVSLDGKKVFHRDFWGEKEPFQ